MISLVSFLWCSTAISLTFLFIYAYRSAYLSLLLENARHGITWRNEQLDSVRRQVVKLLNAIRKHRDQKADDRCFLDDTELYEILPEKLLHDPRVGNKCAMLENCKRFLDQRCQEGHWPTYVELEARIDELQNALLQQESGEEPPAFRRGEG